MNALDIVVVLLLLAYAVSGYWQGFITGAFATTGLLLGGLLGIWLAPEIFGDSDPSVWVSLGALFVVLVAASIGQAVLQIGGARIRDRIPWQPVRAVDAVGGSLLSAVAVLVVAWALGVAVSGARLPWVSDQVRESAVLSRVDSVVPDQAASLLDSFNRVVGTSFFPRYLKPFAQERIVDVKRPPQGVAADPEVRAAEVSVLKIRGENRCGRGVEGSGFLYQPDRIMTNAHVVAGVSDPTIILDEGEVDAEVVYYNPDIDVAVLAVADLDRPFLRFDKEAESADPGAVLGYPEDGPYDVQGARIRSEQRLQSLDIYGEDTVVRDVYAVRGLIRPGNSGGPMVSLDGEVYGVVFAASVSDADTGYVLTADQVAEAAARGIGSSSAVSTGRCA
ncbi:MarP family serine protease [Nocardioides sp. HDW12B]|uniref:MarP family serine protease n=1 Tax=Nocardioides sp. HDW12B TaxID=2714939 RepID=UPI00140B6267|nr:MarP family serine protease [Nocardioides sp. HDW12B]QIK67647.1 MarP family serine protease [Nocardioides sp. HDW12B]